MKGNKGCANDTHQNRNSQHEKYKRGFNGSSRKRREEHRINDRENPAPGNNPQEGRRIFKNDGRSFLTVTHLQRGTTVSTAQQHEKNKKRKLETFGK